MLKASFKTDHTARNFPQLVKILPAWSGNTVGSQQIEHSVQNGPIVLCLLTWSGLRSMLWRAKIKLFFFKRTNDKRSHHDTTGYDDQSGQIWFVSEIITQMAYPEPEFMLTKK